MCIAVVDRDGKEDNTSHSRCLHHPITSSQELLLNQSFSDPVRNAQKNMRYLANQMKLSGLGDFMRRINLA